MSSSSENRTRGRVLPRTSIRDRAAGRPRHGLGARRAHARRRAPSSSKARCRDGLHAPATTRATTAGYADGIAEARVAHRGPRDRLVSLVPQLGDAADALARARGDRARRHRGPGRRGRVRDRRSARRPRARRSPSSRGRDATRARARARTRARATSSPACTPTTSPRSATPPTSRPAASLAIVPDPALAPGDCVVDVAACRIDARIERRARTRPRGARDA